MPGHPPNTSGGATFWLVAAKDIFLLWLLTCFSYLELFIQLFFPTKLKSLKDEIILITGSAGGIGRCLCLELVDSGAKLICWDINKWDNDALVKELKNLGATAYGYDVDVSDRQKVKIAADQVKKDVGDVTLIINNAGIMPCHSFLSHNPKEINRAFEVNTLSQIWVIREFLPKMLDRKEGHIAAVCSAAGLIGQRNLTIYSSSKFAVTGFMESLQDEIMNLPEKPDIKFTTIYPFACNTSFSKNVVHTRFPWVIPAFTEPDFVARRAIEGIRRNKDTVCIPSSQMAFAFFLKSLPSKVFAAAKKLIGHYAEPRSTF